MIDMKLVDDRFQFITPVIDQGIYDLGKYTITYSLYRFQKQYSNNVRLNDLVIVMPGVRSQVFTWNRNPGSRRQACSDLVSYIYIRTAGKTS
jgi:hypothetical protein